jgi:hypothetical protein
MRGAAAVAVVLLAGPSLRDGPGSPPLQAAEQRRRPHATSVADPYADGDAMDGMATAARSGRDDEGDHELGHR